MTKNTSKGFTLAEVLITLGIIGIVAALTLPQMFNKTKNAHLGAQLSTAIATIENSMSCTSNVIIAVIKPLSI